jgi:hypothetical protein
MQQPYECYGRACISVSRGVMPTFPEIHHSCNHIYQPFCTCASFAARCLQASGCLGCLLAVNHVADHVTQCCNFVSVPSCVTLRPAGSGWCIAAPASGSCSNGGGGGACNNNKGVGCLLSVLFLGFHRFNCCGGLVVLLFEEAIWL